MLTRVILFSLFPPTLLFLAGCTAARPQSQVHLAPDSLAHLLETKSIGIARLDPEWVGEAKYTVRTGFFEKHADEWKETDKQEAHLRLDTFEHFDKPGAWHYGTVCISQHDSSALSQIYSFRNSLPSDEELTATTSFEKLREMLGPSQGFHDAWGGKTEGHSSAGWAYFSMKDDQHIETLSIFCLTTRYSGDERGRFVDSVEILRGSAAPAR